MPAKLCPSFQYVAVTPVSPRQIDMHGTVAVHQLLHIFYFTTCSFHGRAQRPTARWTAVCQLYCLQYHTCCMSRLHVCVQAQYIAQSSVTLSGGGYFAQSTWV